MYTTYVGSMLDYQVTLAKNYIAKWTLAAFWIAKYIG